MALSLPWCAAAWAQPQTTTHPALIAGEPIASQPTSAPAPSDQPRHADYLKAKQLALEWLDQLDVDPVELTKQGVKGKKKLGEVLDAYLTYYRHTSDPQERERILERVRKLAQHTHRPEYHNLQSCSDQELNADSMSYFRVLWLLNQFGLDDGDYRQQILAAKPRLDEHLKKRGPWQRDMFAEYYDRFQLEKPPILRESARSAGAIAKRVPAREYRPKLVYVLTHEVFVGFDYGLKKSQTIFSPEDVAYLREVLPTLLRRFVDQNDPDLAGESLSCMTYLGFQSAPVYRETINWLLDRQNRNGTWGDYEEHRPTWGDRLACQAYLHTTEVVIRALIEAYEGDWPGAQD